jgi:quinol-cytochrome oxidoreductase complex cytochrome b subunit
MNGNLVTHSFYGPMNGFYPWTICGSMVVIQFPYLKTTMLCSKLSKGIGHNYYGEPAWPNDILYIFPIVICGIILQLLGLAIHQPYKKSEHANPFATPLEILPEWYLFTTYKHIIVIPHSIYCVSYHPNLSVSYQCFIYLVFYSLYLLVKILIDIKTLSEDQEWYLFLFHS